jgi:ABC-type molybdenum transport system ATPase subunit/photorepair protein PhrA
MSKLRLKSLSVYKFIPLSLSCISRLTYTPESEWQLILGTNGSGKSSLLRVATPTITDKEEFEMGGSKHSVWVNDLNEEYVLVSTYGKTVKHSFSVMDCGEAIELNPGGTGRVYKDLVEKHLKYKSETHNLLTQSTSFTKMTEPQREKLIMDVTDCDLKYPMDVFLQLKSRARDINGAIKRLAVKQASVSQNLDTFTDIDNIREKIKVLRNRIIDITAYVDWSTLEKEPKSNLYISGSLGNLNALFAKYDGLLNRLNSSLLEIKPLEIKELSLVTLLAEEENLNNEYNKGLGSKNMLLSELTKYASVLEKIEETKDTSISHLEEEIDVLKSKYTQEEITIFNELTDTSLDTTIEAYQRYRVILDQLSHGVEYVPYNVAMGHIEAYDAAKAKENKFTLYISAETDRLKHMKDLLAGAVTCNNCSHTFVPGDNVGIEKVIIDSENKLKLAKVELANAEETLKSISIDKENAVILIDFIKSINGVLGMGFIRHGNLPSMKDIVTTPIVLLRYIESGINIGRLRKSYIDDSKRAVHLEELIKLTTLAKEGNVSDKYKALETQLEITQSDMSFCLDFKSKVAYVISTYKKLEEYTREINEEQKRLDSSLIEFVKDTNVHHYTILAKEIETELTSLLATSRSYEDLLINQKFLDEEYEELKQEELAWGELMRALSPKTGLIADAVKSTLSVFAEQVNEVIASVWEHTLEINVPVMNEGTLTYKFPLMVDKEIRTDVSYGSTGEQDIIDFAVKMVIMARKGLSGYPLFMDEVGRSFDPAHRSNLMTFIKGLVTGGYIGQVFMVNHFATEYGGVSNSDINIINSNNIDFKGTYNKCLELEYE